MHAILEACAERQRREHNDRAWLAYNTAFLPHQRRPPSLKSLQIPERRPARQQTWQEQMHMARMITLAYGGTA